MAIGRGSGDETAATAFPLACLLCVISHPETLFQAIWRPGESKDKDFFAGCGVDVMVRGHDLDTGDLFDHCLHDGKERCNKMAPYFLHQATPLLGWQQFDETQLCFGQGTSETNHEEIAEQADVDVLGFLAPCNPARSD